jgi:hyaluronate lyase
VSDPTQRLTGDVVVTLGTSVAERDPSDPGDPEVVVLATSPAVRISIPIAGSAGRSFVARFRTS